MSNNIMLKLSKCRLCLKLGDFYSIFASDSSVQLSNMAMACSEIKIQEGDGLPDKICGECIEKLSSAYLFKQQCERSDTELRKALLNNSGSTEVSSYGRRNSDSGFSNRTDGSTSTKNLPKRRGRNVDPSPDKSYSSEATLLKESYSVNVKDPLLYEGMPPQQYQNKTRSSDSRSNSPAVSELAKFQCQRCNKTYSNAKTLRTHTCQVYEDDSDDQEPDDISSQGSVKIVSTESIAKPAESVKNPELSCLNCGQEFKFNIMLKRHSAVCKTPSNMLTAETTVQKEQTPVLDVPYNSTKCPVCKKMFKKRIYAVRHLRRSNCKSVASKLAGGATLIVNKQAAAVSSRLPEDAMLAFQAECSICTARFSSHILMFKHFQICYKRRGPAPIICKTCDITFTRLSSLYNHVKNQHLDGKKAKLTTPLLKPKAEPLSGDEHRASNAKLKCRECDKTFDDQSQLVMHLAAHMANINDPVKKLTPSRMPSTKGSTVVGTKKKKDKGEFECEECFKKFKYRARYRTHLQNDHDYSTEDLKHININIRESQKCHKCDLCDKKFTEKKTLNIHKMSSHSKPLEAADQLIKVNLCPMKCLHCNIIIEGSSEERKKHIAMHLSKKECPRNEYTCPACNEVFKSSKVFSVHISQHNKATALKLQMLEEAQKDTDVDIIEEEDTTNTGDDHQQGWDGEEDDINAMDFCESVVANIKQEPDGEENNQTVNLSTSSSQRGSFHVAPTQTHKLVVALGGFTCPVCNLALDTYIVYQEHMETHKGDNTVEKVNTFKCNICDGELPSDILLKKHIKEHCQAAETDPLVLQCKECGRPNKNYRAFLAHHSWHKSIKVLKCHICLKEFSKRQQLLYHFTTKHAKNNQVLDPLEEGDQINEVTPFRCHICNKYMKTAVSLSCHVRWHSSRSAIVANRYTCPQCPLAFSSKSRLALHKRKHNLPTPFRCTTCGLYLPNGLKLMQHTKGHKSNKSRPPTKRFRCPVCEQLFTDLTKVHRHIQRSHPESKMVKKKDPGEEDLPKIKFVCKVCGKEFEKEDSLKKHGERHTRKPTFFICSLCGKRNISRKLHMLHIKGHLCQRYKDDPLPCTHCDQKFIRRHDLHIHMYEAHDIIETYTVADDDRKTLDSTKAFQCHVCYKTLAKESTFLRHIDYHNSMRCNYCLKYFNSKTFMDAHVAYDCDRKKVLKGGDPFEKKLKCSDCYKAFSLPIKLRCHLRTQHHKELVVQSATKKEPSTCDFCFTTYNTKDDMERHKRTHSRICTYYGCKQCPKKCASMPLYNRHFKAHLFRHYIEKPLECDDCDEKYIFFNDYSTHLKDAHDKTVDWLVPPEDSQKEEECHICKKTFIRLHNHMNYHERNRCKKCKEYFFADYLYESHICPIESEDDTSPVKMNKKNKTFKTMDRLNNSVAYNPPLEPYQECDFCFKPYTANFSAGMHDRTHSKNVQFGCLYCNKTFVHIMSFKMHTPSHRLRHYKENPLLCKYCGEKFIKYGVYLRHLRDVHNEKESMILRPSFPEQECKICKKTFINLHYHYKYHRQFQCQLCKKYISSERLFKSHVCNNPDEDKDFVNEYDEDITHLIDVKFDYASLRHRPIDKVDKSPIQNSIKELPNIEINDTDLSNIDLSNISLSPELNESNQDAIVSIPDSTSLSKFLADGESNSNSNSYEGFTPVISSTVSLSTSPGPSSGTVQQNERNHDHAKSTIIESSSEILKIVDDLESSFTMGDDSQDSSTADCMEVD